MINIIQMAGKLTVEPLSVAQIYGEDNTTLDILWTINLIGLENKK